MVSALGDKKKTTTWYLVLDTTSTHLPWNNGIIKDCLVYEWRLQQSSADVLKSVSNMLYTHKPISCIFTSVLSQDPSGNNS